MVNLVKICLITKKVLTSHKNFENMQGLVVRNTGSHYVVKTDAGEEINCKIKGNFRIKGIRTTTPVAVGDMVEVGAPGDDGTAFITAIMPRRNYIIRRASNLSKEFQNVHHSDHIHTAVPDGAEVLKVLLGGT